MILWMIPGDINLNRKFIENGKWNILRIGKHGTLVLRWCAPVPFNIHLGRRKTSMIYTDVATLQLFIK